VAAIEAGAESYLEERALRQVFNTSEFDRLIRQHDVVIEGQAYRLDLYDDATRTAVELDSEEHHGRSPHRQRDVNRDVHLATIGIQTLRFTYRDITERPGWCRQMLRDGLRARELRR
jgi:very-short-patch-repair endonuclease